MERNAELRGELLRNFARHLEGERNALPLLAGVIALAAVPRAGPTAATLWFVGAVLCSGLQLRVARSLAEGEGPISGRREFAFSLARGAQSALWASLALVATAVGDPTLVQLPWLAFLGALLVVFCATAAPLPRLALWQGAPLLVAAAVLASRQATLPWLPWVAGFAPALFLMLYPLHRAALRDATLRIELHRARDRAESANRDLAALAATDELTRVPNRRGFLRRAAEEIARSRRYHQTFCLMMIDVDHFKGINDRHGHSTGDEILRVIADLLDQTLRETDFLARFGGDEFALLLPETPVEGAMILAERLRQAVEGTEMLSAEAPVRVTLSCGIADFGHGDREIEAILDRADIALYRAKRNGRNRIEINTEGTDNAPAHRG